MYEYCTSPSSSSIDSESLGVSPSTVGVIGSTCARLKHCKDTNQYCHLADQSSLRFMAVVANRSHAFVGTWAHDSCVCVPDIICAMTACLPFVSKHHANKNSKFCGKKKKNCTFYRHVLDNVDTLSNQWDLRIFYLGPSKFLRSLGLSVYCHGRVVLSYYYTILAKCTKCYRVNV